MSPSRRSSKQTPAVPTRLPHALREHALVADGERGAVVDPQGDVQWLCLPRWHDEPVFAGLMGGAGRYEVTPVDPWHTWGGFYEDGSLVWHGRWVSADRTIECVSALVHPADVGRAVLLRRVWAVSGMAEVRVELRPTSGFKDADEPEFELHDDVWTGRVGDVRVRWQGASGAKPTDDGGLALVLQVVEGQHHDLVLELARCELPDELPDADRSWAATRDSWQRTVPRLDGMLAEAELRRSYAVLAGLTSVDHGMVAAATTALPERAQRGRAYDYRYAWIRDQCYAGLAVAALGPYPLLESAVQFVTDRILADGADLKPAYTVDGGRVPDESHVGLPGYPGGDDIVGNWVNQQFQLDTMGEALCLYAAASAYGMLDARRWQAVRTCVEVIEARWRAPEAGIWELDDDLWTQSRLACVAGLRSIARCTEPAEAAGWVALADRILAGTSESSLHPDGHWQQTPTRPGVDAALLTPPVRGALPADDPRTMATLAAVASDLTRDGHVYRFRHDNRSLGEAEGSFTLSGFEMAMAQLHAGNPLEAVLYYERARSACATSGLFTEEYDTVQHQLRGNFPQAFVHAAFIEATARLHPVLAAGGTASQPAGDL